MSSSAQHAGKQRIRRQDGQGMVEYLLILVFAVLVLAIPWGGHPAPIAQLVDGLKQFYQDYSNYLSLA